MCRFFCCFTFLQYNTYMTQHTVDIDTLATLSRIAMTAEDKISLARDIDSILGFVDSIQSVDVGAHTSIVSVHNILRDDVTAHTAGEYTERLMGEAPEHRDGMVVVKQVVSRTK
jgi:aspartyl/glutamyl-tRNA(Asn/Gln) amidotransferase C subunit